MPSPNNLPLQLTSFIGREREIAEVKRLLARSRLLTLTGAGGSGKTRLALQVASQLLDQFPGGVFFVNLASITDHNLVVSTVAHALDVKEVAGQPLIETLRTYLAARQVVILLDNFEQVMDAATLVVELLMTASDLKVMVTSREALHVQGEQLYQVPPLELPGPDQHLSDEELTQYEAVALFVQRAQAVNANFTLTGENASFVSDICIRLDGLPLALELAAARIGHLLPKTLIQQLDNRLKVLTGGARNVPARQQTLRNTIGWSYDLLPEGEQQLFRRMAVFQGGCTSEALEAICNYDNSLEIDVSEGVFALIDKSLLQQREGSDGEPRFGMLETIHEYARGKLGETVEESELRRQHLAYFMLLVEEAAEQLDGPELFFWMNRLNREHDNFRAALTWALAEEPGLALRLASLLGRFWHLSGHLSEGRRWLERVLAQDASDQRLERAETLNRLGTLAWAQGNYEEAITFHSESLLLSQELKDKHTTAGALLGIGASKRWMGRFEEAVVPLEDSLRLFREIGDKYGIALALNRLGLAAADSGDLKRAVTLLEASVALSRECGSKALIAAALNNLGSVLRTHGDYARAMPLFEESLLLLRGVGARVGIVHPLVNLGLIALRQGNYSQAKSLLKEGLRLSWDVGTTGGITWTLIGLAGLASAQGHSDHAGRLYGALNSLDEPIPLALRSEYERDVASARTRLGEAGWVAAWEEGHAMSLEKAIAYALEEVAEQEVDIKSLQSLPPTPHPYGLTKREVELLGLLVEGLTNEQLAQRLFLSPNTVRSHLYSIYNKLGVPNRGAASRFATEHNLL